MKIIKIVLISLLLITLMACKEEANNEQNDDESDPLIGTWSCPRDSTTSTTCTTAAGSTIIALVLVLDFSISPNSPPKILGGFP